MRSANWILLMLVGCASEPRAKPTSIEIAAADAAVAPDEPVAPEVSRDAGSPYPPSGEYEVTARVLSDDCNRGYTPADPWKVSVQAGAERGRAKVNVPLASIPPSNAPSSNARSDILIEPRRAFTRTHTPMPACSSYTTVQSFELTDSSPNGFTYVVSVAHGDGKACSSFPPTNCTTKVEYVYKLVRAQ